MAAPMSRGPGLLAAGFGELGDGCGDDFADLVFAGGLGHVGLDHVDLGLLLGGELGAIALGEALDRLAALLAGEWTESGSARRR